MKDNTPPAERGADDIRAIQRSVMKQRNAEAIARYGLVLFGLNKLGKPIYQGTVTAKEKARRRARGKVAKASRKVNR